MRFKATLALVIVILASISAHAAPLHVAAAANLQRVLTKEVIPAFTKTTGIQVVPTYGSTKVLATQVENGAPVDVFMAADTETVDRLIQSHQLLMGSKRVYATGQLVIWTRRDVPHHLLRIAGLGDPMFHKIAIANPKLAPYGQAAVDSLNHAGGMGSVAPRIVYAENIAQSLQFAQSGNADAAFTALSLVIDDKVNPYIVVPENLHKPLTQACGIVAASRRQADATRFLDFVTSAPAAAIWRRSGYTVSTPPAKSPSSHAKPTHRRTY